MTEDLWQVEFYADEEGREPCRQWAERLSPAKQAAFIAAVEVVLARYGNNVVNTEFGKTLGQGLYELRIRQTSDEIRQRVGDVTNGRLIRRMAPPEAVLLRVFFCTAGRKTILLLNGYDKADDPSEKRQQRAIEAARKLMTARQEAQKRAKKRESKRGPKRRGQ